MQLEELGAKYKWVKENWPHDTKKVIEMLIEFIKQNDEIGIVAIVEYLHKHPSDEVKLSDLGIDPQSEYKLLDEYLISYGNNPHLVSNVVGVCKDLGFLESSE